MSRYVRNAIIPQVGQIVESKQVVDANDNDQLKELNNPQREPLGDLVCTAAEFPELTSLHVQKSYVQKQAIDAYLPDASGTNRFGTSIVISGDGTRMAVHNKGYNSNAGKVTVFSRSGDTWSFEQDIVESVPVVGITNGGFGNKMAIDRLGDRLAIASPYATVGASSFVGKVYIYSRSGTTWTLEQDLDLSGDTGVTVAPYVNWGAGGLDFDRDADKLVIGTWLVNNEGRADVYTRSGTTWTLDTEIPNPSTDADKSDYYFGTTPTFSDDGEILAIGAIYDELNGTLDIGQLYWWSYNALGDNSTTVIPDKYLYGGRLSNPFTAFGGFGAWGNSVQLSKTGTWMVGSYWLAQNGNTNTAGGICIARKPALRMNPIIKDTVLNDNATVVNEFWGSVVAADLEATIIASGANGHLDTVTEAGCVLIAERQGNQVNVVEKISAPVYQGNGQQFGSTLAMSDDGEWLAVAMVNYDGVNVDDGRVYMYKREIVSGDITFPTITGTNKFIRTK
jgi:hypothetical protein